MADLLNKIEGGAGWPVGMEQGRVAFLAKDDVNNDDPMKFEVQTPGHITSLVQAMSIGEIRSPTTMDGGMGDGCKICGCRAARSPGCCIRLGNILEHAKLTGQEYTAGTIDIAKLLDQIPRTAIYMIAKHTGMPTKVLDTYRRYQEALKVRNTTGGGLGLPYAKRAGIPQGDPLSMLFAAMVMRGWASMMEEIGMRLYLYVDDMLLVAAGERHHQRFVIALDLTHQYLKDL